MTITLYDESGQEPIASVKVEDEPEWFLWKGDLFERVSPSVFQKLSFLNLLVNGMLVRLDAKSMPRVFMAGNTIYKNDGNGNYSHVTLQPVTQDVEDQLKQQEQSDNASPIGGLVTEAEALRWLAENRKSLDDLSQYFDRAGIFTRPSGKEEQMYSKR